MKREKSSDIVVEGGKPRTVQLVPLYDRIGVHAIMTVIENLCTFLFNTLYNYHYAESLYRCGAGAAH